MQKLVGYTLQKDIDEFEQDGFIHVRIDSDQRFTEKVEFTDEDIRYSSFASDDVNDFKNGYILIVFKFTHQGKHYTKEDK